jgi:hypothetical protein
MNKFKNRTHGMSTVVDNAGLHAVHLLRQKTLGACTIHTKGRLTCEVI